MRFDRWFKYLWTFNLAFLILSLGAAAYFVLIAQSPSIESILMDPLGIPTHLLSFPPPVYYLLFIPFFFSGYLIQAIGIIEVLTSVKSRRSKFAWIGAMVIVGVMITVLYYFFGGRNQLTD